MATASDLAQAFEGQRGPLRSLAYRLLGSAAEADDALQEAWLRLERAADVETPAAWLRTVVSRIALDMLRARASRREEPLEAAPTGYDAVKATAPDPADEAELAESVGIAMGVVLKALAPAERVAFVLHDMFELPFEAIAPIVDRTPVATRQLASRARRRVRGTPPPDVAEQREVIEAYLRASRAGDFEGLLAVLDPDVVLRVDRLASPTGVARELRGAAVVARSALAGARHAGLVGLALVDGQVGFVVVRGGRLIVALKPTVAGGRVVAIAAVAEPAALAALDVAAI